MTRIFGYHLSTEIFVLWLIESSVCFLLLYGVLSDGLALTAPAGAAARHGAAILALTIGLVSFALGLYRPESCLEIRRLLVKVMVAASLSLPAIWLVGKLVHLDLGSLFGWDRIWPLQMLAAWSALLLATRLLFALAVRHDLFTRRVLLLGSAPELARTSEAIATLRRGQFRVAGMLDAAAVPHSTLHQDRAVQRLWGVIAGPAASVSESTAALQAWQRQGVRVLPEGVFWEHHLGRVEISSHPAWAMPAGPRPWFDAFGRGLDLIFAGSLLLFTGPLMVVTALLIKVDSPGPVLYRQERVGLGGRTFTLAKFRSMRIDAERDGPVWASARDPRVTRIGAFIRRVRIDELPQLLNILRGEMSLIGPRPERPHFVEQLATSIPGYRERARVKPGLTGWAQVNFPYGASVEDARAKLSYDLYYVKHRSLFLDLMILFATLRVVVFQEGAR